MITKPAARRHSDGRAGEERSTVRNVRGFCLFVCLILSFALPSGVNAATTSVYENPQNGLLTWNSKSEGFSVEFIQLLPDFVRAVFGKQHFPKEEIERIAKYCVFGSIVKNISQQRLSYRVADWYYTVKGGKKHPVKTKTQWLEEWRAAGIGFSWVLLPDSHDLEVGDWQQGFTTVKLPREAQFDFTYIWKLDGVEHTTTIKDMRCPPATH